MPARPRWPRGNRRRSEGHTRAPQRSPAPFRSRSDLPTSPTSLLACPNGTMRLTALPRRRTYFRHAIIVGLGQRSNRETVPTPHSTFQYKRSTDVEDDRSCRIHRGHGGSQEPKCIGACSVPAACRRGKKVGEAQATQMVEAGLDISKNLFAAGSARRALVQDAR